MAKRLGDHKASTAKPAGGDLSHRRCIGRDVVSRFHDGTTPILIAMTSLLFVAAIGAVLLAFGSRRWRRIRLQRAAARRAGATRDRAIPIRSYTEMDDHLRGRWCHCGGFLERTGEGTREFGERRYRVTMLRCQECEAPHQVFFDTTEMLH